MNLRMKALGFFILVAMMIHSVEGQDIIKTFYNESNLNEFNRGTSNDYNNTTNNFLSLYKIHNGSTINDPISILNSSVIGDIILNDVIFNNILIFNKVIFKNNVSFVRCQFNDNVKFIETQLRGHVTFDDSKFNNSVEFLNSNFSEHASFWNVKFGGYVSLSRSRFCNTADFGSSKFQEDNYFINTIFEDESDFRRIAFKKSSFIGVKFNDNTYFNNSEFEGDANFGGSFFKKNAYFVDTFFYKTAIFNPADFNGELNITGLKFNNLEVTWSTIENSLICDSITYTALIKNFRAQEQFDDANNCYYRYREQVQILKELSWSKLYDKIAWITCGYGVRPSHTIFSGFLVWLLLGTALFIKMRFLNKDKSLAELYSFIAIILLSVPGEWYPFGNDRYEFLIKHNIYLTLLGRIIGWALMALFIVVLTKKMIL